MNAPRFVPPQLATLVDEPVEGENWVFERKLDGIRLIAIRDGDVTSFSRLQKRSGLRDPDEAKASGVAVCYFVFDLLHVDGRDCTGEPLRRRTSLLHKTIEFADPLRVCAHPQGPGAALLAEACERRWEGLIAERADRPYRSGRNRDWLKLKCLARQEFVVGGFTEPHGERTLERLSHTLRRQERAGSPFVDPPEDPETHWVTPSLVCEVAFTEWTPAGRLRHPRYLGLREDKDARDVTREVPVATP